MTSSSSSFICLSVLAVGVSVGEEKLHLFDVVGGRHSFDIYKFTRMALDAKHTRYDVPRAALQLLSKHACQFGQYLMDEYEVK